MEDNQLDLFGSSITTLHPISIYTSIHYTGVTILISPYFSNIREVKNSDVTSAANGMFQSILKHTDYLTRGSVMGQYIVSFEPNKTLDDYKVDILEALSSIKSAISATCIIKESKLNCNCKLHNSESALIAYVIKIFQIE